MLRTLLAAALAVLLLAPAARADEAALAALKTRIEAGEIPGVHSVIVMRGEDTLAEWYFPGKDERRGFPLGEVAFGPDTLHDVRSVTKSVVGLLVGVAVEEGAIKSLDTPVLDYFPEYADLQTPERRRVTLRHLLSMTSGLHWDEDSFPYTDPRNSEIAMDLAKDPYRYVLSQPFDTQPGAAFKYSGGDVAVMAAVLARATKTPLEAYAEQKLFKPLGIPKVEWIKDGKGVPYAASGLRMTPRDMAKVGRMVLDGGRWNRRQVIPARWVEAATTPKAQVQPDPTCGTRYGYFWWLFAGCQLEPATPWAAGVGNGGQRIVVVRDQGVVVVMTAGLYNSRQQGQTTNEVIVGALKAVRK
ncbi:serine hydrolase [Phenylobacterium sp.]|uniref:serine hydrolase domain-containing protein n=1 Tax=Phenylobacterium sp. TaxID=1871053 RepID=UPI002ED7776B